MHFGRSMRTLTAHQAVDWVNTTGLVAGLVGRVALPDDVSYVFTVRWPTILPYQVPYFAALFLPDQEIGNCLFWLADNGASGAMPFELACRALAVLRASHGESRPILESPAYLLEPGDSVDAKLLLTMAVLFNWDAYVVPQHGRYYVWIDDDDAADVCCRSKTDYEMFLARFREWGLVPETAANSQLKH